MMHVMSLESPAAYSSDAEAQAPLSGRAADPWWSRPGAWLLTVPGLTWWGLNVAVLTSGALGGRGVGHAGWIAGRPELTKRVATMLELLQLDIFATTIRNEFDRVLGLSAVPSIGLAILCAGAIVTVTGRRGWRRITAAVAAATACGVIGAVGLTAVISLLETVD